MKSRRLLPVLALILAIGAAAWPSASSWAADVGVLGAGASLRSNTLTGKQSVVSTQKDPAIHFGVPADPNELAGQLEIFYVDTPANRSVLPIPTPWTLTTATMAKYRNRLAPLGATLVQSASVTIGKQAKVAAKGLGGIDIVTPPGPGGVVTVLTITNAADASTHRLCTLYAEGSGSTIRHRSTATGYKLSLQRGVPTACPNCNDGLVNGTETDVDCGDACPTDCAAGQGCFTGADCQSDVCLGNVCEEPSCTDGVPNGSETDVDCGGSCLACANGQGCSTGADCQSSACAANVCQAPTCTDGVRNGGETDVDCGGSCVANCATGQGCTSGADCQSSVCTANVCQPLTCTDGVRNGGETDVDCGGSCPANCATGRGCSAGLDCESGVCVGSICQVPTCSDGVRNGSESDVDCGGSCPDCADGRGCNTAGDCQNGVCTGNVCQAPTCADGVRNGLETDIDCGDGCPECPAGSNCNGGSDCQSQVCIGNVCQAPSCSDGLTNGSETDTDCGGPSCPGCAVNMLCLANSDCQTNFCNSGRCQSTMEDITVSPDGKGFVKATTGVKFVPYGWWPAASLTCSQYNCGDIIAAMKAAGANAIRMGSGPMGGIQIMTDATTINSAELDRLAAIVAEAERQDVYLNLGGPNDYTTPQTATWYNALNEAQLWNAHELYWRTIAQRVGSSPAILTYNLINEAIAAPGANWDGTWRKCVGGICVFYLTKGLAGRTAAQVYDAWVARMTAAIRQYDTTHLITMGYNAHVAATSPSRALLDFVSPHYYPENGSLQTGIDLIAQTADVVPVKPVVVDETYTTTVYNEEFEWFLLGTMSHAAGYFSRWTGPTDNAVVVMSSIGQTIKGIAPNSATLVKYLSSSIQDTFFTFEANDPHLFTRCSWDPFRCHTYSDYVYRADIGLLFRGHAPGTVPLIRLWRASALYPTYDPDIDHHTYTTDGSDAHLAVLGDAGYQFARVIGFAYPTPVSGTVELYRYENANGNNILTTLSDPTDEYYLEALGYVYKGIVGYIY